MPREMMTEPVAEPKEGGGVHVTVVLAAPAWRRKAGKEQAAGAKAAPSSCQRIPRITRLMALAIKFQGMLDRGEVRDYADLARLGYVTRARVTQIMNLSLLAPRIQEVLLMQYGREAGRAFKEHRLRAIAAVPLWADRERYANHRLGGLFLGGISRQNAAHRGSADLQTAGDF